MPPKPPELGDGRLEPGGGVLYVGSKGKLLHDTYGEQPAAAAEVEPAQPGRRAEGAARARCRTRGTR